MAHRGFFGMTESGKTSLATIMARIFKTRNVPVFVLDPLQDPRWQADFITDEPDTFLKICKQNKQCALFIDEGSESIGRYARQLQWLTTMSRHFGHEAHLISQQPQQIDATMRAQLAEVYLFAVSDSAAKIISDDFAKRELLAAPSLPAGCFFLARRFQAVVRARIDFQRMKVLSGHPGTLDTLPK